MPYLARCCKCRPWWDNNRRPTSGPTISTTPNFSPLAQITPANVSRLAHAWTFNYGAGSLPSGGLSFSTTGSRFSRC